MMTRRAVIVMVAIGLLFVAPVLFAGGNSENPGGGDEAIAMPTTGPAWAADTSPVTLTAWVNWSSGGSWEGWGSDPVTQEITKRTGVTVNIESASAPDNAELMGMLAANDLPDFVIVNQDSLRPTLWQQGFVQSLYGLMDRYAPTMRNVVPKDMDVIWQEADGDWYFIPGYYSDVDRVLALPGIQSTISGLTFNMPIYRAIGSPAYQTLDDYHDVLLQVKKAYPDLQYYVYDDYADAPADDQRNMAQMINRIYGGSNLKHIMADGSVHLNFRDSEYLSALRYINSLYRDGLFSPEVFTTQTEEQHAEILQNGRVFSVWGQPFSTYSVDMTANGPYDAVEPPQEPGVPLYWRSSATGIGGWPLAAISSTTAHSARAIRYYEFLLSDEGQLLTYHGIEGKDYTWVDNMPKNTPEKAAIWAEDFSKVQDELGIINYQVAWLSSNWADMLYYYWLNQDSPKYLIDTEVNNKFARNERINELIRVPSDSEEAQIQTKIFELWKSTLPSLYLAESGTALTKAYNDFIAQAERLGLSQLEERYTQEYRHWAALID